MLIKIEVTVKSSLASATTHKITYKIDNSRSLGDLDTLIKESITSGLGVNLTIGNYTCNDANLDKKDFAKSLKELVGDATVASFTAWTLGALPFSKPSTSTGNQDYKHTGAGAAAATLTAIHDSDYLSAEEDYHYVSDTEHETPYSSPYLSMHAAPELPHTASFYDWLLTALRTKHGSLEEHKNAIVIILDGSQPPVTVLDLANQNIPFDGITALVEALKETTAPIHTIDLSDNNIGDDGAAAIADLIASNHLPIKNLNLSGCFIQDAGAKAIADALVQINYPLAKLDLAINWINDQGITSLATTLISNKNIRLASLNLTANPFTNAGAQQLLALASAGNTAIYLSANGQTAQIDRSLRKEIESKSYAPHRFPNSYTKIKNLAKIAVKAPGPNQTAQPQIKDLKLQQAYDLLNDYIKNNSKCLHQKLNRGFHLHFFRHHIEFINRVTKEITTNRINDLPSLIALLETKTTEADFNRKGSLARRINFIKENIADVEESTPSANAGLQ